MIFYKAKIWELDLLLLSEQESGIIMYIFSLWHDAPVLRYKRKSKNVTFFVPVLFSSLVSCRKPSNTASIWLGFSFPASLGWSQDVSRLAQSRLLIEPFSRQDLNALGVFFSLCPYPQGTWDYSFILLPTQKLKQSLCCFHMNHLYTQFEDFLRFGAKQDLNESYYFYQSI